MNSFFCRWEHILVVSSSNIYFLEFECYCLNAKLFLCLTFCKVMKINRITSNRKKKYVLYVGEKVCDCSCAFLLFKEIKKGANHVTRCSTPPSRKGGDSNPRYPLGVYTLSRRASSTTRASFLECPPKYIVYIYWTQIGLQK